jgi:hypothetical protein
VTSDHAVPDGVRASTALAQTPPDTLSVSALVTVTRIVTVLAVKTADETSVMATKRASIFLSPELLGDDVPSDAHAASSSAELNTNAWWTRITRLLDRNETSDRLPAVITALDTSDIAVDCAYRVPPPRVT